MNKDVSLTGVASNPELLWHSMANTNFPVHFCTLDLGLRFLLEILTLQRIAGEREKNYRQPNLEPGRAQGSSGSERVIARF